MSIEKNKDKKHASENSPQTDFPLKNEIDNKKRKHNSLKPPVANSLNNAVENTASQDNGLNEEKLNENDNILLGDQ